MRKEDFIKQLENLDLPEVKIQDHQSRLRRALLNSRQFEKSSFSPRLFSRRTAFSMGTFMVAFIVVVTVFGLNPSSPVDTAQAEAFEIVRGALQKVRGLPKEQKAALEGQLGQDLNDVLAEASRANDLRFVATHNIELEFNSLEEGVTSSPRRARSFRIIDPEEFNEEMGPFPPHALSPEEFEDLPDEEKQEILAMEQKFKEKVRLLEFTDSEGQRIQLGVDKDDVPVVKVIRGRSQEMDYSSPQRAGPFDRLKFKRNNN